MTPNLLFDLGGVIMNIDRQQAVNAFSRLGMDDADSFFDPYQQRGLFGLLEEGQISAERFYQEVTPLFSKPITRGEIDRGLFEFLRGIPAERLERLAALRTAGHKVYMLSNTNPIMWSGFILPEFKKLGGDISDYFDGIITSFEVGCCKPDPRIFNYAAAHLCIEPAQTTFYDDGPANVEAARALGFHAEHVSPQRDFMTLTRL
ncbi:MAG: HAD family phosphatase [Bacteroides sp.]|nr:HAD family phosphatase [Bacteroides sp.]MCM1378876.1 HAD family phosphatase [Bacteroides sp.]MCM1445492.1 HAD family phosphatase [Prevotella sp.]